MALANSKRTLREVMRVLFSHCIGILLILVVVLAGVITATYVGPWRYRSKIMLLAKPVSVRISSLESPSTLRDRLSLFITTQRELITSQYVLASALMKMNGVKPPEGEQWYTDEQISEFIASNVKRLSEISKHVRVRTPGGVGAAFTKTFKVYVDWPEERSLAAKLGVNSRELAAKRAQKFAKCLLEAYQYRRREVQTTETKGRDLYILDRKSAIAKANLEAAEKELEKYVAEHIGSDIVLIQNILNGIGETGFQSIRTALQSEITKNKARCAELSSLIAEIDKQLSKPPTEQVVIPEQLLKANPALDKIVSAIVKLRLKLNTLQAKYTANYKEVTETTKELNANLKNLHDELHRQRAMLAQALAALQSKRKVLEEALNSGQKKLEELAAKVVRYNQMSKAVDNAQKILDQCRRDYINAQSAEVAASTIQVLVLDPPSRPDVNRPYRPIVWLNILLGIIAGIILAFVYAFLSDYFDHTLKGADDVDKYVEIPVMMSVPRFGRGIIVANSSARAGGPAAATLSKPAEEVFKGLWTSVFSTPEAPKSLLVCSSNRQEGATTIACGLAIAESIGQSGNTGQVNNQTEQFKPAGKVVLIDFNIRHPSISDMLMLSNGRGISDVLVGQIGLDEALQRVGPGALDVLCAGSQCDKVVEIFQPERIRTVLEELSRRYEHVIVDSAPVNLYPDSQVLAKMVEQIVLVALYKRTSREALLQTKKNLTLAGGRIAGVVLNARTYPIPRFVYRRV